MSTDNTICEEGNSSSSSSSHVRYLENQLNLARREINNLRQQLKTLNHVHRKEFEEINQKLESWQCLECRTRRDGGQQQQDEAITSSEQQQLTCRYIGTVSTNFPAKRGTPRQPGVCPEAIAKLTLNNAAFTNPSHALDGLQEYSHLWILFHFHCNTDSTHVRAKVAPPRLNGIRTGVFATRSPHRPTPIGLSLVKIDRIVGDTVYFTGVDMIDQTPVIDIKPYIPQYDNPTIPIFRSIDAIDMPGGSSSNHQNDDDGGRRRVMDGEEENIAVGVAANGEDNTTLRSVAAAAAAAATTSLEELLYIRSGSRIGEREAPDGEEEESSATSQQLIATTDVIDDETTTTTIRVPSWIDQSPVHTLSVIFKDRAVSQLLQLGPEGDEKKIIISNVLREDPRSVYLRERWGGSHCYVFRISELYVSCKFDDSLHNVTVYQVFQNSSPECDE